MCLRMWSLNERMGLPVREAPTSGRSIHQLYTRVETMREMS